jgi:hypothetical protein
LDCCALVPSRKSRLKYMLRVSKVAVLSSKKAAWLIGDTGKGAALARAVGAGENGRRERLRLHGQHRR